MPKPSSAAAVIAARKAHHCSGSVGSRSSLKRSYDIRQAPRSFQDVDRLSPCVTNRFKRLEEVDGMQCHSCIMTMVVTPIESFCSVSR